jgi:hypothetical protein
MQDLHESSSDLETQAVLAAPRRRSRRRFKHAPRPHRRFVAKLVVVDTPDENPQVCLAFHRDFLSMFERRWIYLYAMLSIDVTGIESFGIFCL